MDKRNALDRATNRAHATNPRAGWKAARERALTWCRVMWPNTFEWPDNFVPPSQRGR